MRTSENAPSRTFVNKGKKKAVSGFFPYCYWRIYLEEKCSKAGLPAAPHQALWPALRYRRQRSEKPSHALEATVGCQLPEFHAFH